MTDQDKADTTSHNGRPPSEIPEKRDPEQKINPDLTVSQRKRGVRPGDTYVRTHQPYRKLFHGVRGRLVATPESYTPSSRFGRGLRGLKTALIGRPLFSQEEIHERLNKTRALAVFGSDAISSCAYATEAAMVVLLIAGNTALNVSLFIALGVAALLFIVSFSYRQIVHAYPQGGGAYIVSRQNLGQIAGLLGAAALLIDYVMTVAVSIAAGSLAISSAIIASGHAAQIAEINNSLPVFFNLNVIFSLFFIGFMTLGNLRGIRESGSIFSIPTYLFIIGFSVMLVVGLVKLFTNNLTAATPPPVLPMIQPLTLWLILRAFSAGSVAMSGTEAIANGVPAFKPPESRNAASTLTIMAVLLGIFFIGVSYLATHLNLVPGNESIVSQVALAVFGKNIVYYIFQFATMGILVVAANTAFAGFPRLASVLAQDNYLPHGFLHRGDRLAFSTGIVFLGGLSAFLLVVFRGNVDSLIHLYAVGVFLAFSLSNTGMVVHWWRTRGEGWKTSLSINAIGAILTTGVLIVVAITKFALGAWIVIILIPAIIPLFLLIHRHYDRVGEQLRIVPEHLPPPRISQFAIVPIDDVNYASLRAMSFARTICTEIIVLHVATDINRVEKVRQRMKNYAPDMKLVVVESPLRSIMRPLVNYVDALHKQHPNSFISIILPEFITAHRWERFLHNRTAEQLTKAFEKHPDVAVILVPYQLQK
jgi:amino acid transporter